MLTIDNPAKSNLRHHIITIQLEDYFHVGVFNQLIGEKQWRRFESRLERNVDNVCVLLAQYGIKATFFTLGWIGDNYPEIIKKIVSQGHEIASGGYWKRSVRDMTRSEFISDLRRAKRALENAGANKIIGYRCPHKRFSNLDLWALDVLAEEGYLYDASYCLPIGFSRNSHPFHFMREYPTRAGKILEIPISTSKMFGFRIPISGGNYLRQFPYQLMMYGFKKWCQEMDAPFVLYFHAWELDPQQPRINSVGILSRVRQYRNLDKMHWLLPLYFRNGHFESISQYLNIPLAHPTRQDSSIKHETVIPGINGKSIAEKPVKDVSVIIPCFNEAPSLPYLARTLDELREETKDKYNLNFIFIDDCSTDDTYLRLQGLFGSRKDCQIIRHEVNRGIAWVLSSGFEAARSEIVCSIDADCSYDPLELLKMIPLLEDGVDMVTASPYHREGFVLNVPKWRLFLSKSLSMIYQLVLRHKLSTYTSCFRVYHRSSIRNLKIEHGNYLGIVELLAKLDRSGGIIREYPTALQCRIFGHSKMKVLKVIIGHLELLVQIVRIPKSAPLVH